MLNKWLRTHLVCPRDHLSLSQEDDRLRCTNGHEYHIINGIPVMLIEEQRPTHTAFAETLAKIKTGATLSVNDTTGQSKAVHPYVQSAIVGTNGNLYRPILGKLQRYPIPEIRLPPSQGKYLLDVGCNWGRWCISAAQKGYQPVGIDPSLEALLAAQEVANQLGITATYVVADCRHLPFADHTFDIVFSYSVLQHLGRSDVQTTVKDMARVLKPAGQSLVQMPNSFGLRNLFLQAKQRFRDPGGFGVRYWSKTQLSELFSQSIGPTELSVDGFFSLNPQMSDIDLLPRKYRYVVRTSEALRKLSQIFPGLLNIADSLYIASTAKMPSQMLVGTEA